MDISEKLENCEWKREIYGINENANKQME